MKSEEKISKRKSLAHIVVFFAYFLSYIFILLVYSMKSSQSKIRYFLLLFCIIFEFIIFIKKFGIRFYKKTKNNSFLLFLPLGILFYIQSVIVASINGSQVSIRTLPQIFLVVSPPIYIYLLSNNTDKKTTFSIAKFALISSVIGYLCEHGHTLFDFFSLSNYSTLFTERSFVESSIFSEIFLQLFLYFNYFAFAKNDKSLKNTKVLAIISGIFAFICNKRLAMVIVAVTPITNFAFRKLNKKERRNGVVLAIILTLLFTTLTIVYFKMLEHALFTDINIYGLSTGRDYILSIWKKSNYLSYGYGSSLLMIGRYLELDLVEIYLEIGLFCLILFCFTFLNSSRKSYYSTMIITYCLLNLLTASGLPHTASIVFMFLSIAAINESNDKDDEE